MRRLLALCLWFASAFASAASLAPKEPLQLLKEQQARDPQFVVQWLNSVGAKTDQKDAKWFFSVGLKEKAARNWSAASKAFGESMIRYPSPQALLEYAEADLRMLGQVRAREGFPSQLVRGDMEHALGFYEAAVAANGVTKTLSPQDAKRLEHNASCLRRHLQSPQPQTDCEPATYFSSGGQAQK
jgi:hypothetical protein